MAIKNRWLYHDYLHFIPFALLLVRHLPYFFILLPLDLHLTLLFLGSLPECGLPLNLQGVRARSHIVQIVVVVIICIFTRSLLLILYLLKVYAHFHQCFFALGRLLVCF